MLAFLTNLGLPELIVILVVAVLIFGKDLPQAASKAYLQARKLRNAVDDLRRDTGIERELRNIERNVREAEWEARRVDSSGRAAHKPAPPTALPAVPSTAIPTAPTLPEPAAPQETRPAADAALEATQATPPAPDAGGAAPSASTDAAS